MLIIETVLVKEPLKCSLKRSNAMQTIYSDLMLLNPIQSERILSVFARTILLVLLVLAMKGTYLLEQPFQSMLRYYGRFRHLTYVSKALQRICV